MDDLERKHITGRCLLCCSHHSVEQMLCVMKYFHPLKDTRIFERCVWACSNDPNEQLLLVAFNSDGHDYSQSSDTSTVSGQLIHCYKYWSTLSFPWLAWEDAAAEWNVLLYWSLILTHMGSNTVDETRCHSVWTEPWKASWCCPPLLRDGAKQCDVGKLRKVQLYSNVLWCTGGGSADSI